MNEKKQHYSQIAPASLLKQITIKCNIEQAILYEIRQKCLVYVSSFKPIITPDIKFTIQETTKILVTSRLDGKSDLCQENMTIIIDEVTKSVCSEIKEQFEANFL
jgi:hypothetical protein